MCPLFSQTCLPCRPEETHHPEPLSLLWSNTPFAGCPSWWSCSSCYGAAQRLDPFVERFCPPETHSRTMHLMWPPVCIPQEHAWSFTQWSPTGLGICPTVCCYHSQPSGFWPMPSLWTHREESSQVPCSPTTCMHHSPPESTPKLDDSVAPEAAPLTSPLKRARQQDPGSSGDTQISFQPARDACGGEPICAHCGTKPSTMYILRRHIEDGYCKMFNAESSGRIVPDLLMPVPFVMQPVMFTS